MRTALRITVFLLAIAAMSPPAPAANAEDDLVHVKSHVLYDIHPDQGPVRVTWDVSILNNDPQTDVEHTPGSAIFFYEAFDFPLLVGASGLTATSAAGAPLEITPGGQEQGPMVPATVKLDRRLFFGDSYDLRIQYEVPEKRHPAVITIPAYAFIPLLASGDEATVDVSAPVDAPWSTSIEAVDCAQNGVTFSCTGADAVFLAAVAEVARPDLTATMSTEVQLRDRKVPLNITYFQGEEAFAQHVSDLAVNALPVLEDIYGVQYFGPGTVNVSERVRQVILGYEGLTSCDPATACEVNISPIADDRTMLHELAHLWSGLYEKRWLAEGFAEYTAAQSVQYLPEGLVSGSAVVRQQPSVELQLDDWGDVENVIGASEDDLAVENAGYFRSLRFLDQLEFELGVEALRRTNQAISQEGEPADSRRFMDLLEDISGRNNDSLFVEWVFPESLEPLISDRREARDRLTNVTARAQAAGLTEDVPAEIQKKVDAWQFQEAFTALETAEAGLDTFDDLKDDLARLQEDIDAAGLVLSDSIQKLLAEWDFEAARSTVDQAFEAVTAYAIAVEKVNARRSAWEQFGLLGSDPESSVERAASAFNDGDYENAIDQADKAIDTIDGASRTAMRRVLIVAGLAALFGLVVLGAVWLSRRREPDFA
ncbi:MAG TPA: hypothetical protein VFO59_01230 [Dehalococcoidia bacterium]|nr:hypothetical protein [Dehalococcoidia bacterium]